MSRYRSALPQCDGGFFLTDGGIETTLIFHEGLELPHFAAFHLLETPEGTAALRRYFTIYATLAARFGAGLVLEGPTWRASPAWGARLGYTDRSLAEANRRAVRLLEEIRSEHETDRCPMVISGCIGPRGDAYVPDPSLSAGEAERYHRTQIEILAGTAADMVCALTLNSGEEAVGISLAAHGAGMPVAISFTVETDGRLPNGQALGEAIEQVDSETDGYPCYFMINCAHPTHIDVALAGGGTWTDRILGLRANASRMSHAELNDAAELDEGNPEELGRQYAGLKTRLRRLAVLGGCCGTDDRHIARIAAACSPLFVDRT